LIQKVKNLKENKNLSVTEIAKVLGISRPTIYKILKQELNYVPYNRLVQPKEKQMKQNKLSFESENLVVDYISFKFQKLENSTQKKIADYLFKLGFNSYKESGKLTKPIKESILVSSKNQFEVCFVGDNPYWDGTLLHFSGLNASRFYFFSKEQIIDWTIFSSAVLSRFDLYFERNYKTADKISGREFLQNCQKNLKQTNKNISLEKNRKGWILKIGNRKSNHYFRIYETKNSLRFEHEMKGKVLQQYHLLLV
jgi:predicted DNA-binding transcriptional regulator AlpA/ribosomal protein S24E